MDILLIITGATCGILALLGAIANKIPDRIINKICNVIFGKI